MTTENKAPDENGYDRKTLVGAAIIFVGFCLTAFYLPSIMTTIGTSNPYITGAVIAAFLVVPFIGLWWRGRSKARNK